MQPPDPLPPQTGRLPGGPAGATPPNPAPPPDPAALAYPAPYANMPGPPPAYLETFMGYVPPAAVPAPPPAPAGPSRVLIGLALFVVGCLVGGLAGFAVGLAAAPPCAARLAPITGETGSHPTPEAAGAPAAIARATALADQAHQVYGPVSGQFTLDGGTSMAVKSSSTTLHDFIATVEFINPYDDPDYGWDYGLIFGSTSDNNEYRLYITSDGDWSFKRVSAEAAPGDSSDDATATPVPNSAFTPLAGGPLTTWNRAVGQSNRLALLVSGSAGYFFLNDHFIATLALPATWTAGDIEAGSAFREVNNKPDAIVEYRNFTVRSLDR